MRDGESTIIPLDAAHEVLATFRIGPENRQYQRWRRDDGFTLVDLEDTLATSPLVLGVDWRDSLADPVKSIVRQLADLGITAIADLRGEDRNEGTISSEGRTERIKYVTRDGDNFDDVIRAINRLISGQAQYRKWRSSDGTDGWFYAVLTHEDWQGLSAAVPGTINLLFCGES